MLRVRPGTKSGSGLGAGAAHREVEGCTLPHQAFGPDPAAVPVDDALHRGKPDAVPGELPLRMQTLERTEEPVGVRHVEARAVIPHEVGRLTARLHHPEFNA